MLATQHQALIPILAGDRRPITFAAEDIAARDKAGEAAGFEPIVELLALRTNLRKAGVEIFPQMVLVGKKMVASQHRLDGLGMALRNPVSLSVFIENVDVAGVVGARKEDHGAVGTAALRLFKADRLVGPTRFSDG